MRLIATRIAEYFQKQNLIMMLSFGRLEIGRRSERHVIIIQVIVNILTFILLQKAKYG